MHIHNFQSGCCDPCNPCSRLNDYNGQNDYGFCERFGSRQCCCCMCEHENCASQTFTVSGTIFGTDGVPAGGIAVEYTVDNRSYTTTTDANGHYSISVRGGSFVTILVLPLFGVTASPARHVVCRICSDMSGYNFTLSAITPGVATVGGTVSGLANVAGVMVNYTLDGMGYMAATDAFGNYSFTAPFGSNVTITPSAQPGYAVTPTGYTINSIATDTPNQNFVYSIS